MGAVTGRLSTAHVEDMANDKNELIDLSEYLVRLSGGNLLYVPPMYLLALAVRASIL